MQYDRDFVRSCHLDVSLLSISALGKAMEGRDEGISRDEAIWKGSLPNRLGDCGDIYGIRRKSSLRWGNLRHCGCGALGIPTYEDEKSRINESFLVTFG